MKLIAGTLALLVGINLILAPGAAARFAAAQTRQVPISRLLRNLEYQRKETANVTDRAMVDFRIGRLHANGLFIKCRRCAVLMQVPARGSKTELPDFGNVPDHVQFKVNAATSNSAAAKAHLKQALEHLQAAVKTDPSLETAKLGLAWCLEQSGEKAKAIALYREVFLHAYEGERNAKGGMYKWSLAEEAYEYLTALLDPVKDKKELDQMKLKVAQNWKASALCDTNHDTTRCGGAAKPAHRGEEGALRS